MPYIRRFLLFQVSFLLLMMLPVGKTQCQALVGGEKMTEGEYMKLTGFLPQEIAGWKTSGTDALYTPANLYEYINGGAELFLSYGFENMVARHYTLANTPNLRTTADNETGIDVDIFDMGSSYQAFGVFTQGCESCEKKYGQGSQYTGGLLTFWKDRYYISILAYPETKEKREAVQAIGKYISDAIPGDGPLPPVISLLPRQGLRKETIRYFHHYIWLNSFYFISSDNILDLDQDTEVAMAKYREEEADYFVLLVLYPARERAAAAYKNFLIHYMENAVVETVGTTVQEKLSLNIKKTENGKWTASFLKGLMIVVVFNADNKEIIRNIPVEITAGPKINQGGNDV